MGGRIGALRRRCVRAYAAPTAQRWSQALHPQHARRGAQHGRAHHERSQSAADGALLLPETPETLARALCLREGCAAQPHSRAVCTLRSSILRIILQSRSIDTLTCLTFEIQWARLRSAFEWYQVKRCVALRVQPRHAAHIDVPTRNDPVSSWQRCRVLAWRCVLVHVRSWRVRHTCLMHPACRRAGRPHTGRHAQAGANATLHPRGEEGSGARAHAPSRPHLRCHQQHGWSLWACIPASLRSASALDNTRMSSERCARICSWILVAAAG